MFSGKKVLVTAGPTYEAIDAVRFIGNRSSGKMGIAIAEAFAMEGANVVLVKGPTCITVDNERILTREIETTAEMYDCCMDAFNDSDIVIMAAAVSDYTPVNTIRRKRKKTSENWHIELKPAVDILSHMGRYKKAHQIIVGFALESENELENAREKLKRKNADIIILNSINQKGSGFQYDTNQVTILDRLGNINKFELKPKKEVAKDILQSITDYVSLPQNQ